MMSFCGKCGQPIHEAGALLICGVCGHVGDAASGRIDESPTAHGHPWEQPANGSLFKAFSTTLYESLFSPRGFFSFSSPPRPLYAYLYALIIGSLTTLLSFFTYRLSLYTGMSFFLDSSLPHIGSFGASRLMAAPIAVTCEVGLLTLLVQGALVVARTACRGIGETFCIVAYSQSTRIVSVIPVIGPLAAFIWQAYILVTGISRVHRTSRMGAVRALGMPLLILLGILFFLALTAMLVTAIAGLAVLKDFIFFTR